VVDTTGHAATETLLRLAAYTDLFLYDLKLMDSTLHKRWTGIGNGLILKNLRCLAESDACFWVRIPLIDGVNADANNLRKTADFLVSLPGDVPRVNLLPFHNIMAGKYSKLGRTFDESGTIKEPDDALIQTAVDIFAQNGINAMVGG
jgi:pyruvate formate lyase activating enzyme